MVSEESCGVDDKRFAQMFMRWLIAGMLVFAIGMAAISPALAIEKQKKDNPPPKPDTTAVVKALPQAAQTKPQVTPAPNPRPNPRVFNDFIDVNKNGIDDRLEQGGNVVPPKQQPKPVPAVKKLDSTKVDPVKKPAEVEKKKDK